MLSRQKIQILGVLAFIGLFIAITYAKTVVLQDFQVIETVDSED